ncbi:hypothetical protein [Polaromonas sp. C04]|uniref:hypothetical protein n=1 Tax=Polaromonas sp. C04 TaxID=1945857 RepID=UPI0009845DBC|nr:hypothetical protein [Polaromonas sp. C04]OOG50770.1 hypothetical protein B0E49_18840 [Polaromonas sp. C04]
MNATKIFAATAFAALASMGAHAGSADFDLQNRSTFNSTRPVAEVKAEAVQAAHSAQFEPAGSRVAALVNSGVDRATVRNETAIALRAGQIAHGEASIM